MRQRRAVSVDGVTYQPRFGLAMRWAISTGRALAYLHGLKHPIIHRDVKPLNLFLNQDLEAGRSQRIFMDFVSALENADTPRYHQMSLLYGKRPICRSFNILLISFVL